MNLDISVIFMSGQIGLEKDILKEKGIFGFLKKTFDINEIFNILYNVVINKNK